MNSCWFRKFVSSDFDEEKSTLMSELGETKWSAKMQFHRKVRSPISVDDLFNDIKPRHIIWMDEESFIMLKELPKTVPDNSPFRTATQSIDFERETVNIYATSIDAVVRVTTRFLCLKDETAEEVQIGIGKFRHKKPMVTTAFITSQFLHDYIEANPRRMIFLGRRCFLSDEEAITLASHPRPLSVELACYLQGSVGPFRKALAQRNSYFGIFSSQMGTFDGFFPVTYSRVGDRDHSEGMSALSKITLATNSGNFHSSQCLKGLTAYPAMRVEYTILNPENFADIEPFTIASQRVALIFAGGLPSRLHTLFLQASGGLTELGLIYHIAHPPDEMQEVELLEAIASNQNLQRLELGCFSLLDSFWDELANVIGSHKTLRSVVFRVRVDPGLDLMVKLIALMKEHIHLDVLFKFHGSTKDLWWKLDNIIKPIRLQNQVRSLTQESVHDRSTIFEATLTTWASGDFLKVSLLLSEKMPIISARWWVIRRFRFPSAVELRPQSFPHLSRPKNRKALESCSLFRIFYSFHLAY
jgi:hypothetical protein